MFDSKTEVASPPSNRSNPKSTLKKARRNYHVFITHALFRDSISNCDAIHNSCISLKVKWRKRVRVERTGDIRDAARRF